MLGPWRRQSFPILNVFIPVCRGRDRDSKSVPPSSTRLQRWIHNDFQRWLYVEFIINSGFILNFIDICRPDYVSPLSWCGLHLLMILRAIWAWFLAPGRFKEVNQPMRDEPNKTIYPGPSDKELNGGLKNHSLKKPVCNRNCNGIFRHEWERILSSRSRDTNWWKPSWSQCTDNYSDDQVKNQDMYLENHNPEWDRRNSIGL